MSGLRMLCKAFGRMQIGDVLWLWDYATDEPCKESDMPVGSERRKKSDIAMAGLMRQKLEQEEKPDVEPNHQRPL